MAAPKRSRVLISFADSWLSTPIRIDIPCATDSREFEYVLRRSINKEKRISPINQRIEKLGNNEYQMTIRQRRENGNLSCLTVHGHTHDEYDCYIDNDDTVFDLKILLAPLVNAKPEHIQLNYNTERRLSDNENVVKSNCLSDDIVIMFWLELPNIHANRAGGESAIIRSASTLTGINYEWPDLARTVRKVCKEFASNKTFGVRKYLDGNDFSKRGEYEWTDYKTVGERVTNLSSGLRALGMKPKQSKVGICSNNRREWIISDYSAQCQSMISVPLYPTLDKNAIEYIVNHAEIECVICSYDVLKEVNRARDQCPRLKLIVLMDDELPDQLYAQKEGSQRKTFTHLFSEVEELGKKKPCNDVLPNTDDLSTIMYTSGTTGNPKGVLITHRNFMCILNTYLAIDMSEENNIENPHHLSYLPLAHSYERIMNLCGLIRGTPCGFFSGQVEALIGDMQLLKPIVFFGVPRVFQKFQDAIMNKMDNAGFFTKMLFNYAYKKKLNAINKRQDPSPFFDKILWSKFREPFGGEIRYAGSGSAPLSKELQMFLKVCLFESVGEGYGLTETTTAGSGSHLFDVKVGHVGMVRTSLEMKLVSVPEMNYKVSDKPCPRGEIWMRGQPIFKGYYKEPEKTKAVLDEEGWFASGDIGLWRAEGRLEIIDRKKNIFKLAQGEYIRPEYIQNCYKMGRFVGNIFIDGNSLQTYLVAIIVPDFEALLPFVHDPANNLTDLKGKSKEVIVKDPRVMALVQQCMKVEEDKAELKGFEKVRKFVLKPDEFTMENGLLTNSMKLKRNIARMTFAEDIKQLYARQSKL